MYRDPRVLLIPFLFLLLSCSESSTYHKRVDDFPNKVWKKGRSLTFEPDIQDTSSQYKVLLEFRHVYGFASAELLLRSRIKGPDGANAQKKEHAFRILKKGKNGEKPSYLSDCSGDLCDRILVLFERLAFQKKGKHKISIQQRNRKELPNVMEVGLKLQKRVKGEDVVIQKKAIDK